MYVLSKRFLGRTPDDIEKSYLLALKCSKENAGSCIMQKIVEEIGQLLLNNHNRNMFESITFSLSL